MDGRVTPTTDQGEAMMGAFAFKQPKIGKLPGSVYSPYYFVEQTGCYICAYFQCRAMSYKTVRWDQQLCQTLVPYKLILLARVNIGNSCVVLEALPNQGDPLPSFPESKKKKKKKKKKATVVPENHSPSSEDKKNKTKKKKKKKKDSDGHKLARMCVSD